MIILIFVYVWWQWIIICIWSLRNTGQCMEWGQQICYIFTIEIDVRKHIPKFGSILEISSKTNSKLLNQRYEIYLFNFKKIISSKNSLVCDEIILHTFTMNSVHKKRVVFISISLYFPI